MNTNCYSDDEEDETAELMRELEKIKKERAEQKANEVRENLCCSVQGRRANVRLGT